MKNSLKVIIPAAAAIAGLAAGLGAGQVRLNNEQRVFEDRIKAANKKVSMLQKRITEERNDAVVSLEQRCQGDIDRLQGEKKSVAAQLAKERQNAQALELKARQSEETFALAKKEADDRLARLKKEIDDAAAGAKKEAQELDGRIKKLAYEKQGLQTGLKNTKKELGRVQTHNARLCIIAEDLVRKYRDKGLGAVIAGNEPLTQLKKVELEQLTVKYQDEIERQRTGKNDAEER